MKKYIFRNRLGQEFEAYASSLENAEAKLHEVLRESALEFELYTVIDFVGSKINGQPSISFLSKKLKRL